MGTFLGILGVGVCVWAAAIFMGGVFGEIGFWIFVSLMIAGVITCGFHAYCSLCDRLDRIEKKLDKQAQPQNKEDVSC